MFGEIDDILIDNDIGFSVVIQRETRTSGGYMGDTVTWSTFATIIASIQNLTGDEIIQAEKLGIQASHRMYCEPLAITENDRVLYNGTYYQITYIDNVINTDKHYKVFLKESDNYGSQSN